MTYILLVLAGTIVAALIWSWRDQKKYEAEYAQDALSDNVYYHSEYIRRKDRMLVIRVEKILWQNNEFSIIKTKNGHYALLRLDKVSAAGDRSEMLTTLNYHLGGKETVQIARQLGWNDLVEDY